MKREHWADIIIYNQYKAFNHPLSISLKRAQVAQHFQSTERIRGGGRKVYIWGEKASLLGEQTIRNRCQNRWHYGVFLALPFTPSSHKNTKFHDAFLTQCYPIDHVSTPLQAIFILLNESPYFTKRAILKSMKTFNVYSCYAF